MYIYVESCYARLASFPSLSLVYALDEDDDGRLDFFYTETL